MLKLSRFHDFLLTVLVNHMPRFAPTMNSLVIALMPKVLAVLPRASFPQDSFLQVLICCLSVLAELEPRQQEPCVRCQI